MDKGTDIMAKRTSKPVDKALKQVAEGEPKKSSKKLKGKSISEAQADPCEYKPTIHLDDKQIPSGLRGVKVGKEVDITVKGKIVYKSENQSMDSSKTNMTIELSRIDVPGKK